MFEDILDEETTKEIKQFFESQLDMIDNHEIISAIIAQVGVEGYRRILELAIKSLEK